MNSLSENKTALLLLSSGLDSAANLVLARNYGFDIRLCLTINYGQRGAQQEIKHAKKLAELFKIEHQTLDLSQFSQWTNAQSGLLRRDQDSIPTPSDLDEIETITRTAKAVWVPNRNGVLISVAAAIAESRKIGTVLVGFNAEEAVTFADNSIDYMRAITDSLKFSTANGVVVESATASMMKKEIVEKIAELKFPFQLLWSCYRDGEKHCGKCESCQRLQRALKTSLDEGFFAELNARMFE